MGYTRQALKGEKLLQYTVEPVHLGCRAQTGWISPHDLMSCTRMELHFRPSALEFYFPYAAQRSLLSPSEMQALQSLTTTTIEDLELLDAFATDLRNGREDAFITQEGMVDIHCYRHDERVASLVLNGDASLLTDKGQVFTYWKKHGHGFAGLREGTPQIESLTARADCANNLRDLWRWVDMYRFTPENTKQKYPPLAKWCDATLSMYPSKPVTRPWLQCPGAGDGKFHYALNATCEPTSPGDTVLLFETKAGWNQHGGPELFTFDNHDPKGGCVLLNDGTVKFIRTKEELAQLRWKP